MQLYNFCFISKLLTNEILSKLIKDEKGVENFVKNISKDISSKELNIFKNFVLLNEENLKYLNFVFSYIYGENIFNNTIELENFLELKLNARKIYAKTFSGTLEEFLEMDNKLDDITKEILVIAEKENAKIQREAAKHEIEYSTPCERELYNRRSC